MLQAIDSETMLIMPGGLAPAPVCFTYCQEDTVGIEVAERSYKLLDRAFKQHHTTWANAPFDLGVIGQRWPTLIPKIFHALDEGRIHDVQSREKLLDIAKGRYRWHEDEDTGEVKPVGYSLDQIARRRKVGQKTFDQWRLHYYKLHGLPLDEWPEDAKTYALVDAIITLEVHKHQDAEIAAAQGSMLEDTIAVEADAVRGHWALHLISAWGFPTEGSSVEALYERCIKERDALLPDLRNAGLVREDGTRDLSRARAMVLQAYTGKAVNRIKEIFAKGDLPKARLSLLDEVPITATGQERMKGIGKNGDPITPISRKEATIEQGYIATSRDVCMESGDPVLEKYARYSQLANLLGKDIPHLRRGTVIPIQTGYQPIMETFRTSSTGFNIQNLRREPGVRECFRARDGHIIVACDFDTAELVSLAQVTYTLFGASTMRDVINAGLDIHLKVAGELTHTTYEDAEARKKVDDEEIGMARQVAKACYHPDTEVLTRAGWRKIGDVEPGTEVVTATPDDDGDVVLQWETPTDHIRQKNAHGKLIHYRNEGIDIRVTPDHRMLYWNKEGDVKVRQARDFTGNERRWANAGRLEGTLEERHDVLRLVVATQADGSYNGNQIRFGSSKPRKIKRLLALLDRLGADYITAEYTNGSVEKGTTMITLRSGVLVDRVKAWLDDKKLSWSMLDLTAKCREVLVEEAKFWAGWRLSRSYFYSSAKTQDIDVMQALAASVNRKTRVRDSTRSQKLTVRDKHDTRGGNVQRTVEEHTGEVVCLTVPSGFLLVRDGGVPLICGNCNFGLPGGMGSRRFVGYAAGYLRKYGHTLTESEAALLKQQWMGWFPEMPAYFDWIASHADGDGWFYIKHPITGRWRGKMSYTAACNSQFQELTAFGAKAAAYAVAREQHCNPNSPLYGTKTLAFVHDELLVEMPEDRYLTQRCRELERVMCDAYNVYTPDVPVSAESTAMRVWSKKAKTKYDGNGNIVVWEPEKRAA